jgi:hypothetical protein
VQPITLQVTTVLHYNGNQSENGHLDGAPAFRIYCNNPAVGMIQSLKRKPKCKYMSCSNASAVAKQAGIAQSGYYAQRTISVDVVAS